MNSTKYSLMMQETYEAKKIALGYKLMTFESIDKYTVTSNGVDYIILDDSETRIGKEFPYKKYWCKVLGYDSPLYRHGLIKVHPYKDNPFFNVIHYANLLLINRGEFVLDWDKNCAKLLNKHHNAFPRGKAFDRLMNIQ